MTLRRSDLVIVLALCGSMGCGSGKPKDLPDLGRVTGKVELDGQPLASAMITFEPKEKGSLSTGTTDEAGLYELVYKPGIKGAATGTHTVRISKREMEAGPEILPVKYNDRSELTATVQSGDNSIDFPLSAK